MTWYIIVFFATSVEIHRIDGGKPACDAVRAELMNAYGKGTAFLDCRCVSVPDGGAPNRKATS